MLIIIILLICILIFKNLSYYLPGFLGAITLYILFRNIYNTLTEKKKWNKSFSSIFLISLSVIFIIFPIWGLINYLLPQLEQLIQNKDDLLSKFDSIKEYMHNKSILKNIDLSDEAILNSLQKGAKYIPNILNSVAETVINIIVALFVLYFMQYYSKEMESTILNAIPFSEKSKEELWSEVNMMVRSNAIGIPILGICQGIVGAVGYWIFGVDSPILLGIITAISTIIPVLGTMTVYVPTAIYLLAIGSTGNAIGLALYGFILIGGIDNILRFTILRKLGDVPPLITVFGVLLGLNLFGMLGLIFGPLIISSVRVLLKVYSNEYGRSTPQIIESTSLESSNNDNNIIT
ncbi:AI-2E family transporter [Sphingobacterium sp. SRCM116780]|uniref:AI-2E family transporter n=1 Tax=Sphingobacterium sp. SRCM116780 TaxID=2907623 RepID=UPI001F3C82C3|nr:AI-2E family transporter [Sphingobacterium sp. SRCM116780]UIR57949.1 AI-2E family transporter [Sphingobacterium sp. SRCM116780]